jgi:predicted O-methyltransferase YrrM
MNRIHQLYGDSATFDLSPYYGAIDLIFIDGSHSEEYVKNDTLQSLKMLKNGSGVIIWHDYDMRGVAKAINELCRSNVLRGILHIEHTSLAYMRI